MCVDFASVPSTLFWGRLPRHYSDVRGITQTFAPVPAWASGSVTSRSAPHAACEAFWFTPLVEAHESLKHAYPRRANFLLRTVGILAWWLRTLHSVMPACTCAMVQDTISDVRNIRSEGAADSDFMHSFIASGSQVEYWMRTLLHRAVLHYDGTPRHGPQALIAYIHGVQLSDR